MLAAAEAVVLEQNKPGITSFVLKGPDDCFTRQLAVGWRCPALGVVPFESLQY